MRNLDKISELVVRTSDHLSFVRRYLPFLGEGIEQSSHAHLVLADGVRCLHGFFMDEHDKYLKDDENWKQEMEVGPRNDLVNILRKGKPKTFDDLLMLVSFYLYSGDHNMALLPIKPYTSDGSVTNQVLDSILSKSRGWLLWQYQLDRVYAIFERNSCIRRDLLRDFRLRRGSSEKWMKSKQFDDGQCLSEVVEQRTWVRSPVSDPAMPFTFRLANLLFSERK